MMFLFKKLNCFVENLERIIFGKKSMLRVFILLISVNLYAQSVDSKRIEFPVFSGCENFDNVDNARCFIKKLRNFYVENIRENYLTDNNVLGTHKALLQISYTPENKFVLKSIETNNLVLKEELRRIFNLLNTLLSSDERNNLVRKQFAFPLTLILDSTKKKNQIKPAKYLMNNDSLFLECSKKKISLKRKYKLSNHLKYYKIQEWKLGMKFKVVNQFSRRSLVESALDTLTNRIIIFKRHEEDKENNQVNSIFEFEGVEFVGNTFEGGMYSFNNEEYLNINSLVYYDEVELVRKQLLNKVFHLLIPFEKDDKLHDKYKITSVESYYNNLPVIITCLNVETLKKYTFALYLSGTNVDGYFDNFYSDYFKLCNFDNYFISEKDYNTN